MKNIPIIFFIVSSVFALTSCQIMQPKIDRTQLFTLNASNPEHGIIDQAPVISQKITVLPVRIPKYLDRPQIVMRRGSNNVDYSEFLRWAEPLEDGIARVMIAELENNLGNGSAYTFPYHGTRDESKIIKLRLEILSFEIVDDTHAVLNSRWEATANDDNDLIASGHGTIQTKVHTNEIEARIQALSNTLSRLAARIANALKN